MVAAGVHGAFRGDHPAAAQTSDALPGGNILPYAAQYCAATAARYYGALGPRSGLRRALTAAVKAQATCDELEAGFAVQGLLAAAKGVARAAREAANKASRAWAACIRRIFEVEAVLCEGCGGEMKLVAVILQDSEIDRVLDHLGLPRDFPRNLPARAPPLPFGGEAGEGSQLDPRADDVRQDWPGRSGAHWPA